MKPLDCLFVAFGGALGAVLRFATTLALQNFSFPLATLVVNLLGCLLIGFAFAAFASDNGKLFFITGLLGSFTTFSTFSFDNFKLLESGSYQKLFFNISVQLVLGIALVWLGYKITMSLKAS